MQEILDELVRWTGYAALRLVTFGLYRGGGTDEVVLEAAVGIVVVAGLLYLTYAFSFG
jgi:hypothetical protein